MARKPRETDKAYVIKDYLEANTLDLKKEYKNCKNLYQQKFSFINIFKKY